MNIEKAITVLSTFYTDKSTNEFSMDEYDEALYIAIKELMCKKQYEWSAPRWLSDLYFRSLDEEIPSRGEMVLIKVKDNPITDYYIRYYVCHAIYKNDDGSDIMFEEAGGEQFMHWQSFEVSGWMPISALDNISLRSQA